MLQKEPLPSVRHTGSCRAPFSVAAVFNSYRFLRALRRRYQCQKGSLATALRDDSMMDVLIMLHEQFHRSELREQRATTSDLDMRRERAAAISDVSCTRRDAHNGSRSSFISKASPAEHLVSLAGRLLGGRRGSSMRSVAKGQSRDQDNDFPLGSPWEGCEELADEDLVDFLAESSQGWHDDAGHDSIPASEELMRKFVDKSRSNPINRWDAAIDSSCRETMSISTATGSIMSWLSTSSCSTDSKESVSARASEGPSAWSIDRPDSACMEEEPVAKTDSGNAWELEFAARIRHSMQCE